MQADWHNKALWLIKAKTPACNATVTTANVCLQAIQHHDTRSAAHVLAPANHTTASWATHCIPAAKRLRGVASRHACCMCTAFAYSGGRHARALECSTAAGDTTQHCHHKLRPASRKAADTLQSILPPNTAACCRRSILQTSAPAAHIQYLNSKASRPGHITQHDKRHTLNKNAVHIHRTATAER